LTLIKYWDSTGSKNMAGEFKHKDVGIDLSKAEWEGIDNHILDSQATGDLIIASSVTQLSRLAIGIEGKVLKSVGGIPTYSNPPNAAYTLATNDASVEEKAHANATLTGTADQIIINAAIETYKDVMIVGNNVYTTGEIRLGVNAAYDAVVSFLSLRTQPKLTIRHTGASCAVAIAGVGTLFEFGWIWGDHTDSQSGIRFLGMGQSRIIGVDISDFKNSCLLYDAANSLANASSNYIFINSLDWGGTIQADYGIDMRSAAGVLAQDYEFWIPLISESKIACIRVGDNASLVSQEYHSFHIGPDLGASTGLWADVMDHWNYIDIMGGVPSIGTYDILIRPTAAMTKIDCDTRSDIRVAKQNLTSIINLPYREYSLPFESIDNIYTAGGTGTVAMNAGKQYLSLLTTNVSDNTADARKYLQTSWASLSKSSEFSVTIAPQAVTNDTLGIWVGNGNTGNHYGFSAVNGALIGECGNGSALSTTGTLISMTATTPYLLHAIYNNEKGEVLFFVDGVYKGALTTNLPTGAVDLMWNAKLTTNTTAAKELYVYSDFVYKQRQ
jgi:hypothetical protein